MGKRTGRLIADHVVIAGSTCRSSPGPRPCERWTRPSGRTAICLIVLVFLTSTLARTPVLAQAPAARTPSKAVRTYTPGRTPWGDPDISGVYTNNDESLTPFERPAEFDGRRLDDIT